MNFTLVFVFKSFLFFLNSIKLVGLEIMNILMKRRDRNFVKQY